MFFKKAINIQEKMSAINERIAELEKKRNSKFQDVQEKKGQIAILLGELALGDDEKKQASLALARKALERITESYEDLNQQLTLLQENRKALELEYRQAEIRELPTRIEAIAEEFNALLKRAIGAASILSDLHKELREKEQAFLSLSRQYEDSSKELNIFQPLTLKQGLGELSTVNSPYRSDFQVMNIEFFLQSLISYQNQIRNHEIHEKEHPHWGHEEHQRQLEAAKPPDFIPMVTKRFG